MAVVFDGFMKVYRGAQETFLPDMIVGDAVTATSIKPEQHFTEPPARYSDATLIKILEEHGIGRPSTYAPTLSTIIDRGYIDRDDGKRLFPKDEVAFVVNDLLMEHFPNIVDFAFTAKMEKDLDRVADGEEEWVPMLKEFYGPFHATLKTKTKEVAREEITKPRDLGTDPVTGLAVVMRGGRFGPYVMLGDKEDPKTIATIGKPKMASLGAGMTPETVTLEEALKLLVFPKAIGTTAEGDAVSVNMGPYGPYIKIGKANASVPPDMHPGDINTVEQALEIFKTAKEKKAEMMKPLVELGEDPESKGAIQIKNGRFGPYVTDGKTNISIPKSKDPLSVTHEEAIAMLAKKRVAPKRAWGKGKKNTKKDAAK
jgi:DNA topoisomerase I